MKKIQLTKTDYEHFKKAVNKANALDEIIDRTVEAALRASVKSKDYSILQLLKQEISINDNIIEKVINHIELLNKQQLINSEEKVNKLEISENYLRRVRHGEQFSATFITALKPGENFNEEIEQNHETSSISIKEYVASMLLQFAVFDNNIKTASGLIILGGDPRIEDQTNGQSAISFALLKKERANIFLEEFTKHERITSHKLNVTDCLVLSDIRFIEEYDTKDYLLGKLGELYNFNNSIE